MNKEKIKEFFWPDWKKIVLTIILFIISFILFSYWFMMAWICTDPTPECEQLEQSETYKVFFPILSVITIIFYWPVLMGLGKAGLILSIIWIYFLSCVIIFAYNKFKKMKK